MKELYEYRKFMKKEEMHKALNSLVGILAGVASDGKVNENESNEIKNWYSLHEALVDIHPFSEILPSLKMAFADEILDIEEVEGVLWLCNKFLDAKQSALYFDAATSQIQKLEGILYGIIADGVITDDEFLKLNEWLNDNDHLSGIYPYDEVYSLVLAAKEDGVISDDEKNMLKAFFSTFVDTRNSYNIHEQDVLELQKEYSIGGICAVAPEVIIKDRMFCFTGKSEKATRNKIASIIEENGGRYSDRVTNDTDYLIVGADGNPCWAYSCYGRKVEKAVNMRKDGHRIVLVNEIDFWDEIG